MTSWQLIEEMAIKGAELFKPVYDREQGLKGRISIQTNPTLYRDAEAIANGRSISPSWRLT